MIKCKIRDNGALYMQTTELKDYGYFRVFNIEEIGYRIRLIKEPKGLYTLYNFKKNYRQKGIRKIAHSKTGLLLPHVFYAVEGQGIRSSVTYEISPLCKGRGYIDFYFPRFFKV